MAASSSNGYVRLGAWRVMMWALALFVSVSGAVIGWSISQVVAFERRLAVMEGNRFTSRDGVELWNRIQSNYPPKWLMERLSRGENRIQRIEDKLDRK